MEKSAKVLSLDCVSQSFQIEYTKTELEKTKRIFNSVIVSKLPDKGKKLKDRIDELEDLLQNLSIESETVKNDSCEVKNNVPFKNANDTSNEVQCSVIPQTEKCTSSLDDNSFVSKKDTLKTKNYDLSIESEKPITPDTKNSSIQSDSKIETLKTKDYTALVSKKPTTFSELAAKNVSEVIIDSKLKSPSFSTYREHGKIKLTEAKPLLQTSGVKKAVGGHYFNRKPLIDVNEDSVKKIQGTLAKYPDDTLEESDPENLKSDLMTHQRRALAWLMWREEQDPSGGILADDMGLGKTITIISLILKQKEMDNYFDSKSENYECKGTLIVCLASILNQWNDEITKHCHHAALNVLLYHGTKRERSSQAIMKYDVVLTTYNIAMSERKTFDDGRESPLFKLKWERIVLDEAHTIKNHKSQTAEAIFSLKAFRRWAVTGTPIHNVFKDMYSLVKFLRFAPFDDEKKFKKLTDDLSESSEKRKNLLVKSLILRRTKEQVDEKGNPIVKLKKKSLKICLIELSDEERKVYDKLKEKASKKFDQFLSRSAKVKSNSLLVLLLRLQQCCNHVSLLGKDVEDDDISDDITKTLSSLAIGDVPDSSSSESSLDLSLSECNVENISSKDVKSSKIKKLFGKLKKLSDVSGNRDKSVIVSQWVSMLDIVAHHLIKEKIKYYLIAGSTKAEDRQKFAVDFNTTDDVKIMLLSLKAGGVGLNLTGANHLFLLDLHWNPALEMQACDRIHRVGQEKDVTIHKFICLNTIEEQIKSLQDNKRSIASSSLHGVKQDTKGMTFEDFKTLFSLNS